jgi:plasmid maintenance system antidote protein VapI/Zn-dependent peptidase ImmA (M78 family)
MGKTVENEYNPSSVSPPGGTIRDILDERGISQAELAERMGRSEKFVSNLVHGEAPLKQETALQLERVLNVPAHFWNRREQQYREALAREEEETDFQSFVEWMDEHIPVGDMVECGWIQKRNRETDQVREVLDFFGVTSPQEWESIWMNPETKAAFRKTLAFASEPGGVAAWLRYGERAAQDLDCPPYDEETFKDALREIRTLSLELPDGFDRTMREKCRRAGVVLVFTPQVEGAKISGATRWLKKDKALVQMSLRYKTDDQFWFTFFHEAAHVLLHGKRDVFLEDTEEDDQDGKEQEADDFAANFLIPEDDYEAFVEAEDFSFASVRSFAETQGIAPGIVVGRLQHDGNLPWETRLNGLKQSLRWVHDEKE